MIHKLLFLYLMLAALILSACAPSVEAKPLSAGEIVSSEGGAVKCVRESDATRLLMNGVQGYCLQYPAEYDLAIPNESQIMLIKSSMVNVSEPSAHITVRPSEGKTVEQVADQLEADYAVPGLEVTRTSITIDEETAIVVDGLTGQDVNRQVVVVHGDRLYQLSFMPMDNTQEEVYQVAEQLYEIVVRSFNFNLGSNLCPDCP